MVISDPDGHAYPNVNIIPGEVRVIVCDAIWDVNHDGIADIRDIVLVGQHFGERPPGPPYPNYDVNRNGIINIQDIVIIGQHFGQSTCWI